VPKRNICAKIAALCVLTALCLAVFVPSPARAASSLRNGIAAGTVDSAGFPGICYAENGEADTRILFPPEDGSLLFGIGEGDWTGEGPVRVTRRHEVSSPDDPAQVLALLAAIFPRLPEPDAGDILAYSLDLTGADAEVSDFRAMQFGVCFEEGWGDFPLSLTLVTSEGRLDASVTVSSLEAEVKNGGIVRSETGWSVVTVDLGHAKGTAERLDVFLGLDPENLPARTYLSAPSFLAGPTAVLAEAERYSSLDLRAAEPGGFSTSGGRARCDSAGKLLLSGTLDAPGLTVTPGVPLFFAVETEGTGSGAISLGLDYENGYEWVWTRSVSLADGLTVLAAEPLSPVRSYALSFDGMAANASFRVNSVRIFTGGSAPLSGNDWLGRLSRIEKNGDAVYFEGSMTRDAARRFTGENIEFYALPSPLLRSVSEADHAGEDAETPALPEPLAGALRIGETRVSTRFEATVVPAGLPVSPDACLYFAAVRDGDGNLMPLSSPRYASSVGKGEAPARELASFGLAEASPVGVFESNASRVLVDVPLDELIGSSGGIPAVYAVPGEEEPRSVSLDSSLVSELERDVQFYLSAGIEVYLRFEIPSPVPGLTAPDSGEGRKGYMPDMDSPAAMSLWRALAEFFGERFPAVGGMVLPGPANDPETAGGGADFTDPASYAEKLAGLCALTYRAAADSDPDLLVVLPLRASGGDGEDLLDPRLLTVMTACRIAESGEIPWAVLTHAGVDSEVPAAVTVTAAMAAGQTVPAKKPEALLYLYEPTQEGIDEGYRGYTSTPARERTDALSPMEFFAKEYLSFSDACGPEARAVFASLSDVAWRGDHDFYDMLKRMAKTNAGVHSGQAQTLPEFRSYSREAVWDFSSSYHSLGWIPGGGALSCVTEPNALFSESRGAPSRVLSVRFQNDGEGVAGIVMRNLSHSADLGEVAALLFEFSLEAGEGETPGEVSMVFVVGTDEKRAEYYADGIRCGNAYSLGCRLSDWEDRDRVDYIGIAVYADFDVSLKLGRVTAGSRTASPEALRAVFLPAPEEERGEEPDESWLLPVLIFAAAATFAVFVLLTRKDAEDAETGKAGEIPDDPYDLYGLYAAAERERRTR